ncbi:3-oxoadipate enol-lactonase [Noviherbaspirillum saxi]|uniref:3-oxoadipate enol-lactonase n=1 Tax=Noviherbaspirillum saxi TaxID=2320863 RepID=A0A3A3G4K3_9BURK|nr:3-oxoadipate enol-lactonase [Noviherbaspirillum saxi]RJF95120.1 3-oxoadipate enol-lactonase [Noviherbaspirillum saxi]
MPTIRVNDIDLHYRLDGPQAAPVLVFINSIATDLTVWDAVVPALQNSFGVLRYDARGQGKSTVTDGPYSIDMLGNDLLSLLDSLSLRRVHLCGLSLGAMVGMRLATKHPERIDKLVLCNTAAQIGPPESWDARAEAVRGKGMSAIRTAVLERWLSPEFVAQNKEGTERVLNMAHSSPVNGYIGSCAAIRDMDQRESIKSITAPTIVVAGTADAATPPADARYIANAIPRAIYTELPGGHLSNVEQPTRLGNAVRSFLLNSSATSSL